VVLPVVVKLRVLGFQALLKLPALVISVCHRRAKRKLVAG